MWNTLSFYKAAGILGKKLPMLYRVSRCIVDVIIPNLVHVLFDPAIPTSSFNLFFILVYMYTVAGNDYQIDGKLAY